MCPPVFSIYHKKVVCKVFFIEKNKGVFILCIMANFVQRKARKKVLREEEVKIGQKEGTENRERKRGDRHRRVFRKRKKWWDGRDVRGRGVLGKKAA